jgi:hypothetical protein
MIKLRNTTGQGSGRHQNHMNLGGFERRFSPRGQDTTFVLSCIGFSCLDQSSSPRSTLDVVPVVVVAREMAVLKTNTQSKPWQQAVPRLSQTTTDISASLQQLLVVAKSASYNERSRAVFISPRASTGRLSFPAGACPINSTGAAEVLCLHSTSTPSRRCGAFVPPDCRGTGSSSSDFRVSYDVTAKGGGDRDERHDVWSWLRFRAVVPAGE